jgi:hypothetical protein
MLSAQEPLSSLPEAESLAPGSQEVKTNGNVSLNVAGSLAALPGNKNGTLPPHTVQESISHFSWEFRRWKL